MEGQRYKIQRLRFGTGPWVDDVVGCWTHELGDPRRQWVSGFTREQAEAYLVHFGQVQARAPHVPARRMVPFEEASPCIP